MPGTCWGNIAGRLASEQLRVLSPESGIRSGAELLAQKMGHAVIGEQRLCNVSARSEATHQPDPTSLTQGRELGQPPACPLGGRDLSPAHPQADCRNCLECAEAELVEV